jgi:hypothetical protein
MSAATNAEAAIGGDAAVRPGITITFFTDEYARRRREERLSPGQLAERIARVSQPEKARLPWLKCARFGDRRSDKDSLRHDGNVDAITGIEGDYDAKPNNGRLISFEEALARVRNAGISAIVYTSPSFTEDLQKYRVLAPLSEEHPPEDRDRHMARLNGLFDGEFAPESWVLSQSYYYGAVNHNPSHRIEVIDGICIDQADYLDANAIGRPQKPTGTNGQHHPAAKPEDITDKRIRGHVESLLDNIRGAKDGEKYFKLRDISYTLGGYLHIIGWSVDQAVEALVGALPSADDWEAARRTARKGVEDGQAKPLDLEERPHPKAKKSPQEETIIAPEPTPVITVVPGKRHKAADEGLAAMRDAGVQFYIRDKTLVCVCRVNAKAANGSLTTTPAIVPITIPMLGRALGQSAVWQALNKKGEPKEIDTPRPIVEQIADMVGEWPFPPLVGIINTPTMRPDGSLLLKPGYDPITGYFLFDPPPMPSIPEKPSRQDAEKALEELEALYSEFPFVDEASKSVALSMPMTTVIRAALNVVPMHTVSAPSSGTGKTHLLNTASAIATGDKCAMTAMARNAEETEKRLVTAALAQHPIIAIDNVSELLLGDFLCQVTEQDWLRLRPLGTNNDVRAANSFTVFANGNNLTIGADNVRRTIQASLDAGLENPEDREFEADPVATVLADRGKYIAAVLTIVRAYIVAGLPGKLPPTPSYRGWSDYVRSALVWLGKADPVATIADLRAADPIRQERTALFAAMADLPGGDYRVGELAEMAEGLDGLGGRKRLDLWEALFAVAAARSGDKIDLRRLGRYLAKNANNIAGGFRLFVDNSDARRPKFSVMPATTGARA